MKQKKMRDEKRVTLIDAHIDLCGLGSRPRSPLLVPEIKKKEKIQINYCFGFDLELIGCDENPCDCKLGSIHRVRR